MHTTTATLPLPSPSPAVAATLPGRSYEREREESVSIFRGLMFATLFAVAIYGSLAAGIIGLVNFFTP